MELLTSGGGGGGGKAGRRERGDDGVGREGRGRRCRSLASEIDSMAEIQSCQTHGRQT